MSDEGDWYRKKDDEARRLRNLISEKQALRATLDAAIKQLEKQLEMAEYVGD